MLYVFYNNDPYGADQGGGVEHFRGIARALKQSTLPYQLIAVRKGSGLNYLPEVEFIGARVNILHFFSKELLWFWRRRRRIEEQDVFHFHRNYLAWPKFLFAGRRGRVILTYHGLTGKVIHSRLHWLSWPIRALMIRFERKMLSQVDRIIFVSERDRAYMKEHMLGEHYSKTVVIPAAFNAPLYKNAEMPPPSVARKIIVIGRLAKIKNIPLALDAFARVRAHDSRFSLTVVGGGEEQENLQRLASHSAYASAIQFIGCVEHHRIPQLLSEHGILLLTSESEASPTVVKEALAAKRYVVSVDVGDVNQWIQDRRCGSVCASDAEAITQALLAGATVVEQQQYFNPVDLGEISEEKIMQRVLDEYSQLLAAPGKVTTSLR